LKKRAATSLATETGTKRGGEINQDGMQLGRRDELLERRQNAGGEHEIGRRHIESFPLQSFPEFPHFAPHPV
jgi:hypothetical protein